MKLAPISIQERIDGIDIARGLALLGILLVNMRFFFWPMGCALAPTLDRPGMESSELDAITWAVVDIVLSFKCISLFSILFGFGLAMQCDRLVRAGVDRWAFGLRRLGALAGIGLLHAILLWYGDILFIYGILGVAVIAMARLSQRVLLRVFIIFLSVMVLLSIAGSVGMWVLSTRSAELVETSETVAPVEVVVPANDLRGLDAIIGSGSELMGATIWKDGEIAANRDGPMSDAFLFRVVNWGVCFAAFITGYGWHLMGMMVFGVWAYRSGFFLAQSQSRRIRLGWWCFAIGLGSSVAALIPIMHSALHTIGTLILPIGYAALIVEYAPRWPVALAAPLKAAGRMALSIYLAESIICVFLASWWGLGWYASIADFKLSLMAIGLWSALVVWATLWLRWRPMGPAEWLWRRLSYGTIVS